VTRLVQMRNSRLIAEKTIDAVASVAGPNPYDDGSRPTMTFNDLRQIDNIGDCSIQCSDGAYIAKPVSISNNVLTFLVLQGNAGANTEVAVGDTINMSGITFYGQARGQAQ